MIDRDSLVEHLNVFLECDKFSDYAPNGLQIEGRNEIKRICTAVSAGETIIEQAISLESDMLLVHHGYFWKGERPEILGAKKRKFSLLLQNDINLCAYHLPLDAHSLIGNNACLSRILQVKNVKSHTVGGIQDVLWTGDLNTALSGSEFADFLEKNIQKPLFLSAGTKKIHKIAWCSGAGQNFIENAALYDVDAYISGEASEKTFYQAQELGVHFFACGHHATERFGIKALGEHLASKFGIEHKFIDINNPV